LREGHTLYRTDDVPHVLGELLAYTCPVMRVWWLRVPETAPDLPVDAIPLEPASD
jgi:hypothetical protein